MVQPDPLAAQAQQEPQVLLANPAPKDLQDLRETQVNQPSSTKFGPCLFQFKTCKYCTFNHSSFRQSNSGAVGQNGPTGNPGSAGAPGPSGAIGQTGAAGAPGPKGDQGAVGAPGATGAAGPQGIQGIPGPIGQKGNPGGPGFVGEK